MDNFEFKDQKIVDVEMEKEVQSSFINYAMSVIVSRALPDVRDGLKPVHRRILYAMWEDHLTSDKPFRKSATTVGNVLGRYHPHGDSAVYDAMVRLAQDFSLRYPLVDGHGNFGNLDGDGAAAYRYTEARLSKIANEMLSDLDKEVVTYSPNFDNKLREPDILPSRFPNLLVNGSMGIAVGMATNIPPHNLKEVIDATIYMMDNPDCGIPALMEFIKGPDFPTGATICGSMGIYSAYTTGRGRICVRAKAELDEDKHRIIVTEIPYQVNKSALVESIADCVRDKRVDGIVDVRDESANRGVRIVIDCRKDANMQIVLNKLYSYTQLEDTCAVIMLAIVDGVPRVLNLKEILYYYIRHQEDVVTRRIRFDLERALREMHILQGYKFAIDNIDRVIEIIRASKSVAEAKENLMSAFAVGTDLADKLEDIRMYDPTETGGLSEAQAQAIVEMPLGRLSGLERDKILDRLAKLAEQVKGYRADLADPTRIHAIIKEDLLAIRNRYADERRTELLPLEDEIVLEDLIERHTCVISMTHSGYIKRQRSDVYTAQRRGGKGVIGMGTKEEDFVEDVMAMNSHSYLMLFTNFGRVQMMKAYMVPESGRTAKGTAVVNLISLSEGEHVAAMISVSEFKEEDYLLFVTKKGLVKRTSVMEYARQRKGGKIALGLNEGDELIYVRHTSGNDDIIIATKNGIAVRFNEKDARPMGRNACGVRGILLKPGDEVKGCTLVDDSKMLVSITENGFGKRTSFDEYATRGRGGSGLRCHRITERTGALAGVAAVSVDDDLMMITSEGTMIRISADEISKIGRDAQGVIVMRLNENDRIVNFAYLESEKAQDAEIESANAEKPVDLPDENVEDGVEKIVKSEKHLSDTEDEEI